MKEKKTKTIIALVFGVLGFLLAGSPIGFILGIVAVVFAIIALNTESAHKRAIVALVLGILAVIIRLAVSNVLDSDAEKTELPVDEPAVEEATIEDEQEDIADDNSVWGTVFTPISDFRYVADRENKTITLIRYEGEDTRIMLSPIYNLDGEDYSLVSMGDEACFLSETYTTSVYIPEGVTFIGASCFNSCSNLADIYIPASLTDCDSYFLSYLHDYDVVYESVSMPADRDTSEYPLTKDDTSNASEMGEGTARAINGMLGGLNSASHDDSVVHIHYGGTEEQWKALFGDYERFDDEESDVDSEAYQKGKEVGDKLAEELSNIDW